MTTFVVKMKPTPKERARSGKSRHYTPPKTAAAEALIGLEANKHFKTPAAGPVEMKLRFVHKVPKSWSKKKKLEHIGRPKLSTPDLDNLVKLVKDALNGIAYNDDGQVWRMVEAEKVWGEEDLVIVTVT